MSFQGFDENPHLRIDLRFVQRGGDCCSLVHSLQAAVLYTTMLSETGYVFVGPAVGYSYYDEHIVDLSAVAGVGSELARTGNRVIGWEASYSISLPAYWVSYYGVETGDPPAGVEPQLHSSVMNGYAAPSGFPACPLSGRRRAETESNQPLELVLN